MLDEEASECPITVEIYRGEDPSLVATTERDSRDGSFELRGLTSGTYRVDVLVGDLPLVQFHDVAVEASSESSDPRIAVIDLRGELLEVGFRVTNHDDEPISGARVTALVDAKGYGEVSSGADGTVRLWTRDDPDLRVHVSAEQHRDVVVARNDLESEVALLPGYEVQLTPSHRFEATRGTRVYFLTLRQEGTTAAELGVERVVRVPRVLLSGEPVTLWFPAPGTYRLAAELHYDHGATAPTANSGPRFLGAPFEIEVADQDAPQELTLPLPDSLDD